MSILSHLITVDESKRLLAGDPESGERQRAFLEAVTGWFRHAALDWPEGLRFDHDLATLPQVFRMKGDLQSARTADRDGAHREFLDGFETKLSILIGQLKSDEGRCFF